MENRISAPRLLKLNPLDSHMARANKFRNAQFSWVTENGKQERHLVTTVGKFNVIWNFQQVKDGSHKCCQNQVGLKSCYCYKAVPKDESIVDSRFVHEKFALSDSPEAPLVEPSDMGCLVSTPNDTGGNRRRPSNIVEVSVFVPGLRIPKHVAFSQSLGDHIFKSIVERLSALRTRIVVMARQEAPTITRTRRKSATQHGGSTMGDLLQVLEDYLPVLLGLIKNGSPLQHKVQFVRVNQEDEAEESRFKLRGALE